LLTIKFKTKLQLEVNYLPIHQYILSELTTHISIFIYIKISI